MFKRLDQYISTTCMYKTTYNISQNTDTHNMYILIWL